MTVIQELIYVNLEVFKYQQGFHHTLFGMLENLGFSLELNLSAQNLYFPLFLIIHFKADSQCKSSDI